MRIIAEYLTQLGQRMQQEVEEITSLQQQLNASHARREVKLAELELRCTQLEQEAEKIEGHWRDDSHRDAANSKF